MPDREHTDRQALEAMLELSAHPSVVTPWYGRVWAWLLENVFREPFEPVEPISQDEPIRRRIRVHHRSVKFARRLHRLQQEEAREILEVTAMLLGFEASKIATRRVGLPRG